jgi:hypothetical protein
MRRIPHRVDNDFGSIGSAHRHDLKEVRGAVWSQVQHLPVILIRGDQAMIHRMSNVGVADSVLAG